MRLQQTSVDGRLSGSLLTLAAEALYVRRAMRHLVTTAVCPMGHGKLQGYTMGSRLIVEALLIAFLVATYLAASLLNFGPSSSVVVAALLVLALASIVTLDFYVLKYRCSTCGLTLTRRELATRNPP